LAEHLEYLARRIAADEKKQVRIACDLGALGGLSAERASALQGACIQLVRNAVAHGIEMPAERRVKGKLPMGELQIRCETKDGQVNFMVRDDGVGIVPDRLREQFIKGGVLSAKEAYTRSDREIAQLIFKPGVSTREGADRDAGHGIGLDAVLEQVHRMGGQLNVKSQPNEYTEFHIRFAKEQ
jgi:chemotaxis protein histidine kinase CheA